MRILLLFMFCLLTLTTVTAQKKDSTWIGAITGVVRDSVHDYELPSATVAIYRSKDTSLISYQLTDNIGVFRFKQLPTGIPLQIIISYVGYKKLYHAYYIDFKNPDRNIGELNLDPSGETLDEVTVTVPPVQLNGDTLEFNAAVFKLDPAAQAEDLLKQLPGVTVWNDGSITVNGKQVSQVLVDGKPFFGGDTKIATQNIPKDAIDKIQVYKHANDLNPLDSTSIINIKLMKSKNSGHFGKLSAGAGTNRQYEADASMNYFTPRTQLGIAGSANNVNKIAEDVSKILRNSTFKGVGANIEYQPELGIQGENKAYNGGFTYQHDYIPDPGYFKNNRLTVDYFMKDHRTVLDQQTSTTTRLIGNSSTLQETETLSDQRNTGQTLTMKYENKTREKDFHTSLSVGRNKEQHNNSETNLLSFGENKTESSNRADIAYQQRSADIGFQVAYAHQKSLYDISNKPDNFNIDYSIMIHNDDLDKLHASQFKSFADSTQNRFFHRNYDNSHTHITQLLSADIGDLSPILLGDRSMYLHIHIKLKNDLELITDHTNNKIKDQSVINDYLSNNGRYTIINDMPSLNFTRNFVKFLDNRYNQTLTIDLNARAQIWQQTNHSDHAFQNIRLRYQKFLPTASISYTNDQFSAFQDIYTLRFEKSAYYPTVQQLVPLIDSTNLYYIQIGNAQLKPADKQEVSFMLKHTSMKSQNPFNYILNTNAGNIENFLTDASSTDSLGRTVHQPVNAVREKHAGIDGTINKAFRTNNNQLEVMLNTSFRLSQTPNKINNTHNISKVFSNNHQAGIAYSYGNIVSLNLSEKISLFRAKQTNANQQKITSQLFATILSGSLNITNGLSFSSNISINNYNSTGSGNVNYNIWNANASYRIGKMKTMEIKFSALDLLHENKGIYYTANNNILSYTSVNVLQQYFMLTLAWYPRKFGKNEKK